MTDDEIFEMTKSRCFEFERRDETFYGARRAIPMLTSTLLLCGRTIIKIAMPETKEAVVEAIRTTYKIGAVKRLSDFLKSVDYSDFNEIHYSLPRQVEMFLLGRY